MSKLLAALLLSAASLTAQAAPESVFAEWLNAGNGSSFIGGVNPGGTEGVTGSRFFIQDPNEYVYFKFVTSHASYDLVMSVRALDESGNAASPWQQFFTKTGNSVGTIDYYINPLEFTYGASNGYELVFMLVANGNSDLTFYSGVGNNNDDEQEHVVAYYDYWNDGTRDYTLVGWEDLYGGGDFDYDDLVFLVSNVGPTSAVPEPETLALLLAGGLGLLTPSLRRRRDR
ncbi:MAG: DUF4114 domain-containing protein [Azoarcus sp.]|jgi:hypothetical protein|nr:DUF4114 domain-containing protein [Azoarcus sp.]